MKEDDEGIRFHTLLTAGMHRGGQILPEKRAVVVCLSYSWAAALLHGLVAALGIRGGVGGGARHGAGGRAWL
jgi:hypothetical protein